MLAFSDQKTDYSSLESDIQLIENAESYKSIQATNSIVQENFDFSDTFLMSGHEINQDVIEKFSQISDPSVKKELESFYVQTVSLKTTKARKAATLKKNSEQFLLMNSEQKKILFDFLSMNLDSLGSHFFNEFHDMWLIENPKEEMTNLSINYIQELDSENLSTSEQVILFEVVDKLVKNPNKEMATENLVTVLEKTVKHPRMFYQSIEIFKKYHPDTTNEEIQEWLDGNNIEKPIPPEN